MASKGVSGFNVQFMQETPVDFVETRVLECENSAQFFDPGTKRTLMRNWLAMVALSNKYVHLVVVYVGVALW